MPHPIVLTDKMKQKAKKDFANMLENTKMSDGKLCYNVNYKYEDSGAVVWLTQEAYRKILALVMDFPDEIGWHGTVSRSKDDEYIINDIYVYPQEVTGSTVNTEQESYTKWLYELDDDTFNTLRMQGHSHCNMGVSPSGVDDKHRQSILAQLEKNMFYIFQIWNKSLSVHTLIYDMSRNILYEDNDIDVKILGDENMDDFLADAKEKVQEPSNKKSKSEDKKQSVFGADFEDFEQYHQYGLYEPYGLGGSIWNH